MKYIITRREYGNSRKKLDVSYIVTRQLGDRSDSWRFTFATQREAEGIVNELLEEELYYVSRSTIVGTYEN